MATESIFTSNSPQQTKDIAADLINSPVSGRVIALIGELGSGKTTFAQGIGEKLGIRRMLSPTYTLIRQHPLSLSPYSLFSTLYHIDLYRLSNLDEIENLGLAEILGNPDNLVLIEWPEKAIHLLPPHTIRVNFERINQDQRKITITTNY